MENLSRADSAMMIALLRRHNTTLFNANNISGAVYDRNEAEFDKSASDAGLTREDITQAMFLINTEMMKPTGTSTQIVHDPDPVHVPPEPLTYADLCRRSSAELDRISYACNPPIKHFSYLLSYDEKIELISKWFGLEEEVESVDFSYDDEECAAANRRPGN